MLRVAEYFQHSDTGRARPVNEDAVFARPPLFAVADGMGGAQAGEVASSAAVAEIGEGLPEDGGSVEIRLAKLVANANERVHGLSQADAEKAGMGTTLTVVYLGEDDLAVAHVGDSRLYHLRAGQLEQATDDHSLVGELVRRGQLSPEEAEDHPQRSIITRALGPEDQVDVDHHTIAARDGDLFLLCSDGLTSMIANEAISKILSSGKSLEKIGKALVKAANEAGGRDNISVVRPPRRPCDRHRHRRRRPSRRRRKTPSRSARRASRARSAMGVEARSARCSRQSPSSRSCSCSSGRPEC